MSSGEAACMLLPSKSPVWAIMNIHTLNTSASRSGSNYLGLHIPLVRSFPPEKQDEGKSLGTKRGVSSSTASLRRRAAVRDFAVLACKVHFSRS